MRNAAWALAQVSTDVGLSEQSEQAIRLLTERVLLLVARLGEDLACLALETEARFRRLDAHVETCARCRPRGVHKLKPCSTLVGLRREVTELERAVESGRRYLGGLP